MPIRPLEGLVIGVTADRRWKEQAALLERRGATVVHGPTIVSQYIESDDALREVTESIIADPPEYLVANTGVGMRVWFETAQAWDRSDALIDALAGARIVARGAKAASVVQSNGLSVWARAGSERLEELADLLEREPLAGRRVVVQEHGHRAAAFGARLTAAGAVVVEVPIYRWQVPDDESPARRLVDGVRSGRIDAVTFTSAPAVHNLFEIAARTGTTDDLRRAFNDGGVVAGCVGSVCADAARELGIEAPVWPVTGRLGLLVRALSEHYRGCCRTLSLVGHAVTIQGNLVMIGEQRAALTPRERGVLEVLLEKPGAVASRSTLLHRVWGSASHDPHALEMTVARLRSKLGLCRDALHTVAGRGYRLVVDERA